MVGKIIDFKINVVELFVDRMFDMKKINMSRLTILNNLFYIRYC